MLAGFWVSDYGLHLLLVALLLMMFVAPVFVAARRLHPVGLDLFFSVTVVSGVMTVARRGRFPVFTLLFALLTIGVRWAQLLAPSPALAISDALLSGSMVGGLAALILTQVFRAGPVTTHRIEGAVAVYLLLGIVWGNAYRLVWLVVPGAFTEGGGPVADPSVLYYFSFVTLTTVGYGDILPVAQAARGLATMEALTGQLYPAILIARLVSLEIASRHGAPPRPPGNDDASR